MKKFRPLLFLLPVILLLVGCNSPVKPVVTVQLGNLDATITVPDGCGDPCYSVSSSFTLGEDVDETEGMQCETNFGGNTSDAVQPMRQATHTYPGPGEYTVKFKCTLQDGNGGSWFQGGEKKITVPLTPPVVETEVPPAETEVAP